jgi:SAM-dependent methyltransferase
MTPDEPMESRFVSVRTALPPAHDTQTVVSPFNFFPTRASRIAGLGGEDALADPTYVFHSPYVGCKPGPVTIRLHFKDLKATEGKLIVRVNMMSPTNGNDSKMLQTQIVPLRAISEADGMFSLTFKARKGGTYAVLGNIQTATDATASAMEIVFDGIDDGGDLREKMIEGRQTIFGQAQAGSVPRISGQAATLASPVSQMCTASQFDEPVYDHWLNVMKAPQHRHRKQWEFVYVLQSLQHYGMLKPDHRGIGFGVGVEPLPAIFASLGCSVLATDLAADDARAADWSATAQHVSEVSALRFPHICPDDRFDAAVSYRPVDMTAIPEDLVDFDFCWSSCAYEHLGSIKAGLKFVQDSIRCLKPGGLAVHTTELNLSSNADTVASGGTVLFRRQDIEGLVSALTAEGRRPARQLYRHAALLERRPSEACAFAICHDVVRIDRAEGHGFLSPREAPRRRWRAALCACRPGSCPG